MKNKFSSLVFGNVRVGRGSVYSLVATVALAAMICPVAVAQIAIDNTTITSAGPPVAIDGDIGDAGPVVTFSHTIGGGSDRILVVGTAAEGIGEPAYDTVVTSVTYDGVAMTAVPDTGTATNGPGMLATLHYMLEADLPTGGAHDVVVTYSAGTISMSAAALSITNAMQQSPEDSGSTFAPSSPISVDITTLTADALLVNIVGAGDHGSGFTSASGMTVQAEEKVGTQDAAIATKFIATPGTQSIGWSYNNAPNRMAQVVIAFEAIPPIFSVTPSGGVKQIGDSHTFKVALSTPVGAVSYQWKKDGANVGPDSGTYELLDLTQADSGSYWAVVTDESKGEFTTDEVTLTVVDSLPTMRLWGLLLAVIAIAGIGIRMRTRGAVQK